MSREKEVEKRFRTCLENEGWFVRHVEMPEHPGFPDLFAARDNQFALIEVKVTPEGMSVYNDFALSRVMRPLQSAFFYSYSNKANCAYLLFVDEWNDARLICVDKTKDIIHRRSLQDVCEEMGYFEGTLEEIVNILTKGIVW